MLKQPSENPTYKLYALNILGLAEPTRMLFAYGGIKFEDIRVEKDKGWLELKPKMPMGQVPVLEIDGIFHVHQSVAIARYAAKLVGLAGKNDWEDLQIDIAVNNVDDFHRILATVYFGDLDEAKKRKKLDDLNKETIPFYLKKLDAIAKENNGYLALGRFTWADVFFHGISNFLNYMLFRYYEYDYLRNYPNLQRVLTNTSNVESIKAWIAVRPDYFL